MGSRVRGAVVMLVMLVAAILAIFAGSVYLEGFEHGSSIVTFGLVVGMQVQEGEAKNAS